MKAATMRHLTLTHNALRTFHDSGVYDTELGQIDAIA